MAVECFAQEFGLVDSEAIGPLRRTCIGHCGLLEPTSIAPEARQPDARRASAESTRTSVASNTTITGAAVIRLATGRR